MSPKRAGGFTLLELMVVIAIVGILSMIAYANYSRYAYRSRRSEGQQYLLQLAAAEERYFTNFNTYSNNITGGPPGGLNFAANPVCGGGAFSTNCYYSVTAATAANGTQYTLTATPAAAQTTDVCGALTLNNNNQKTPAPGVMPQNSNGACWQN